MKKTLDIMTRIIFHFKVNHLSDTHLPLDNHSVVDGQL